MAQAPLQILCIEPQFPGRLGAVADWLVRYRGYRAWFFYHQADPDDRWPESVGHGLEPIRFNVGGVARESSVAWTRNLERGLCYAYGAWEVIEARRPRPVDLILGHSDGLGSTLFATVTYPRVPVVNLFDHYLHPHRNDLADEDVLQLPPEYVQWRRSANAMDLLDLENGVIPWTASDWQRDLYPPEYRDDFQVIGPGVDTRRFSRERDRPRLLAGRAIGPETRVVTFVCQVPDRLRGFDRFLNLANRLLAERPDVVCIVVGDGPVRRMLDLRHHGQNYADLLLAESPLIDPDRFWRLGSVSPDVVAEVLAASDLHVYPSRPYPVARSLLEAMAVGAVILAWDSEPIREYLEPERTALLVPPDDPEHAVRAARAALDDRAGHRPLGEAVAHEVQERHAQAITLPRLAALFDRLVSAATP